MPQNMFHQRMQYIEAMYLVPFGYREVEADQGNRVWFWYSQRRIQGSYEIGQLVETDELGCVGVVPKTTMQKKQKGKPEYRENALLGPPNVEHL